MGFEILEKARAYLILNRKKMKNWKNLLEGPCAETWCRIPGMRLMLAPVDQFICPGQGVERGRDR